MLRDHGGEPPEPILHRAEPALARSGGGILGTRQPRRAASLGNASIRPKPRITGATKGADPKHEDLRPYNHFGRSRGDSVRVAAKGLRVKWCDTLEPASEREVHVPASGAHRRRQSSA